MEIIKTYDALPRNNYSKLAVVAFLLGLASVGGIFFTGIPAIIVGHIALCRPKWLRGRGLAIAGLILGYIMTLLGILLFYNAQKSNMENIFSEKSIKEQKKQTSTQSEKETQVASAISVDLQDIRRKEALLAIESLANQNKDEAYIHLVAAVGNSIREKRDITNWEGIARVQLANFYFQKNDLNKSLEILDSIIDNDLLEKPTDAASLFRLLKAQLADVSGDPQKACEAYNKYFRSKLARKELNDDDKKVFVRAWKLAIDNHDSVNLSNFCSFDNFTPVDCILATKDKAVITRIRDMLMPISKFGYEQWIEEIDRAYSLQPSAMDPYKDAFQQKESALLTQHRDIEDAKKADAERARTVAQLQTAEEMLPKVEPLSKKVELPFKSQKEVSLVGRWRRYTPGGKAMDYADIDDNGRYYLKDNQPWSGKIEYLTPDKTESVRICNNGKRFNLRYNKTTDTLVQSDGCYYLRIHQNRGE